MSILDAQGWCKAEAGKFNDVTNKGFTYRSQLIKDSKSFELMGALFLNFFRQGQYLISQTSLCIKLLPSKPEFAFNAHGARQNVNVHMTFACENIESEIVMLMEMITH